MTTERTETIPQVRGFLRTLHPYTPGEQVCGTGIIKLNTNECPYPPSGAVLDEIRNCADRLRLYPEPTADSLRRALAAYHGVALEQVLVGNGSDEILRLMVQAFIAPGDKIAMVEPSYSLYEVLAATFEGGATAYPMEHLEGLPEALFTAPEPLLMLPNPNPPIGTLFSRSDLARLCSERPERMVLIDEAYVDFAPRDAVSLLHEFPNLAVSRTFSKSFSLAGLRVGYLLAAPQLIAELMKIKDSYNVNAVSQIAAAAAIAAAPEMQAHCEKIVATRTRVAEALTGMGYRVPESHGNFVFAIHPDAPATFAALRERGILVRYFDTPTLRDGMRITIGTDEQMDRLLEALEEIHTQGDNA